MKVMTRYLNLDPDHKQHGIVEQTIRELATRIPVEAAEITVERLRFETPPVRARFLIVTPGPDIEVEARDYTLPAAFLKARRELLRRAGHKQERSRPDNRPAPRPARAIRKSHRPHQPRR